jgi:hypothetical protein
MSNETKLATNSTPDLTDANSPQLVAPTAQAEGTKREDLAMLFEEVHTIPTGYAPVKIFKKVIAKVAA